MGMPNNKIRVLHLFERYLYTTEKWVYQLLDNVPNNEIIVASKDFTRCNFYPSKFDYIEFPVRKIDRNQTRIIVRIVNRAIKWIMRIYPWYLQKMAQPVDLIHAHYSTTGWDYLGLARRLNKPLIISFYGYDYECLPFREPIWKRRYSILFEQADAFICEGMHGVKTLRNSGCPPDKIQVVPLGVDVDDIEFIPRQKPSGELKLLQVATFRAKKGHRYTIEAFIKALEDCPNMSVTLVGPDDHREPIREELKKLIEGTVAAKRVTFLTAIDFEHLYELMADYQVFIHPSCYTDQMDCEGGAPVVLLDAQATGMPVISSTHCDIIDEVIDGKTGLLTPEKDYEALAKSIRRFYHMGQEEYDLFCLNARTHIEEKYDVKKTAVRLGKVYENVTRAFDRS